MTSTRPYQVILHVGPNAPTPEAVRVVDLTPGAPTGDDAIAALTAAGIGPSDLRARVLFTFNADTTALRDAVLLTYAAILGFAGRRIDFAAAGRIVDAAKMDSEARRHGDVTRPETALLVAQVGGRDRNDMPHINLNGPLTPGDVAAIRYARRLRFVPPSDTATALAQLLTVAAIRARGPVDKLPLLCDGTEPAPDDDTADEAGICLDTLRRAAESVRRQTRGGNREAIAEAQPVSSRLARLAAADALPLAAVLARLGAKSQMIELDPKPGTEEYDAGVKVQQEVWHCPRPWRHTNGDATPSARISARPGGGFQCFRCDKERIRPLRLVADTLTLTPDEAADWLLSNATIGG